MAGRLISLIPLVCCLAGGQAGAFAQSTQPAQAAQLADPTRPPADILAPAADAAGTAASATHQLQSIMIKQGGRPAAMINGTVVQLGGQIGAAKLVQVGEDFVVLLGPEGRETLRLMPDATKQPKVGAGETAKPIGMNAVKGEKRK